MCPGLGLPQLQQPLSGPQLQQQDEEVQQPQPPPQPQLQTQPQLLAATQALPAPAYNPQGGSARVTLPNLAMRHTGAVLKPDVGTTPDSWQVCVREQLAVVYRAQRSQGCAPVQGYLSRQEPAAPRSAASSDSPVDNTAEAKAERTRARNRSAMK